jgi:hypothetical protein
MSLTTDPNDPRLGHGSDDSPRPQQAAYLVLSDEERAKGFVRPVRTSYRHVGTPGPRYPLRNFTREEFEPLLWKPPTQRPVKFEDYPETERPALGRYWTQAELDAVGKGCGTVTTMGQALAETYAREPHFYGATYCCGCSMHRPVGRDGEFVWLDGSRVGT